jgi:ACS family hexuronate transporter-like MFS transporter
MDSGMSDTSISNLQRWVLFGLLAIAGILGLIDRQIIAVLKPTISAELGWSDKDYGNLSAWFQFSIAIALLGAGPLADRLGVKLSNAIGVFSWSVVAMVHGLAHSLIQFTVARASLGVTEAIGIPNSIKTVAAIFPPHLRSTGFGLSNAIASGSAIAAPILIPLIAIPFGWRGAYVGAGLAGIVWAIAWVLLTRKIPMGEAGSAASQPKAAAGADGAIPSAGSIFTSRGTWAVAGAKILSDSTWFLMLLWMPDFMHRQFGLTGLAAGPYLALAYAGAAIGSFTAGGTASALLMRGLPVNTVRKGMMLASGLIVLPLPLALHAATPWVAASLLGLVLAGHQGFSTNLFALITDVTPAGRIGKVTGFAAFCGNMGGVAIAWIAGHALAAGLGYGPMFLFAAVSYLLALGWIQLWLPKIEPVDSAPGARQPMMAH